MVFLCVWALVPQNNLAEVGSLSTNGSPGWQASAFTCCIILPSQNTWLSESSEPFKQPCQLLRQPQLMETIMQISTLSTIFASWSEGAPPPQVWQVTHRRSPDQTRSRCSLWLMGEGSFQATLPPIHQTHPSYLILTPQGLISDLWFS